jgi:hypothetical protein
VELRDVERPTSLSELIADERYGYGVALTREQSWEARERIQRQMAERKRDKVKFDG